MPKKLLFLNGSRNGKEGQSQRIIDLIKKDYQQDWTFDELTLLHEKDKSHWKLKISAAQAFIFITGTYWDSWGSPLQYFLEESTQWETSELWLGKPAAVIVTMHSVGGKEVLSRLQGVLNTLGLTLPPLTGFAYSLAGQLALASENEHLPDIWSLSDLSVVMKNLQISSRLNEQGRPLYVTWPVDKENFEKPWL